MSGNSTQLTLKNINLASDSHWRGALVVVFLLALICRFVVFIDLGSHPAGQMEQWQATEPWMYWRMGQRTAVDGNWALQGTNLLITRPMAERASLHSWAEWSGNRLPRGAAAVYLMAISYSFTASLAIYRFAALIAGAFLAVSVAAATARIFGDRRAGFIAGILAASYQPLVLLTLIPGPWIWEGLVFSLAILCFWRIRADTGNPAEWLLLGLVVALGIWLRPFFYWSLPLLCLACWRWRIPFKPAHLAIFLIPVILSTGGLMARNAATRTSLAPTLGFPAWQFIQNVNSRAQYGPTLPNSVDVLESSDASFLKTVTLSLDERNVRESMPAIISWRAREFFGARDVADTINLHYIRRQSEAVRVMTLVPDVMLAAGWAALLFLLLARRLPIEIGLMILFLLLHSTFLGASGTERVLLHTMMPMLVAMGLFQAWSLRRVHPSVPFLFLALWAAFNVMLQIDDHARGTRFRETDFVQSSRLLLMNGNRAEAEKESADYRQIMKLQREVRGLWNLER